MFLRHNSHSAPIQFISVGFVIAEAGGWNFDECLHDDRQRAAEETQSEVKVSRSSNKGGAARKECDGCIRRRAACMFCECHMNVCVHALVT